MSKNTEKRWTIKSIDKKDEINIKSVFRKNEKKEPECAEVRMTFKTSDGTKREMTIPYLDLLMYIYTVANSEQRWKLAIHKQRKVRMIPYDVTFALSDKEKKEKYVTRRVELKVDELVAAYAQQEGIKQSKDKVKKS